MLLPHPAGPVTMRMWWWVEIVILAVSVSFMTAMDLDGEPVLEAGGVGGDAYCMGFGCDRSTVCIMVVQSLKFESNCCGNECL